MRATAVLLGLLALGRPADTLAQGPDTRMAFVIGGRANTGELGRRYYAGFTFGAEAGYVPHLPGTRWSFGVVARLLGTYTFVEGTQSDLNVESAYWASELGLGLRARVRLGSGATYAFVDATADLLRAGIPLPPDDSREYFGPSAGGGLEIVAGSVSLTLGARYGLITGGPSGLTLLISFGVGE